jgi:hypothetical protein
MDVGKKLVKTKTAQFGPITEEDATDVDNSNTNDKSNSFISLDKSKKITKKLKFKREVEVVYIQSYKDFNIQVFSEKSDQICGGCNKCSIF